MYGKYWLVGCFLLCFFVAGLSQENRITFSGVIEDGNTGEPLPFANVFIERISRGAVTDIDGYFEIKNLEAGEYHITFSHVSCETRKIFIDLRRDTSISVIMDHSMKELETITVTSTWNRIGRQQGDIVRQKSIDETGGQHLAQLLESVPGVNLLSTGSGIGKPIVQGLYGNRLTILNNGVAQSGQQWGNDHSPEIDPMVASRITVVKGVDIVEYTGNSLGSLILVEPGSIPYDPHLHGKTNLFYESNGRGTGVNIQLHQGTEKLAWKVNGTWKQRGDQNSPDYYLRNTGVKEANLAAQLNKKWSEQWNTEAYFSLFTTEIGTLRGAHIGNLTDLLEAFDRDIPFYTEKDFTYRIESPKQDVHHYLWKTTTTYTIDDRQRWEWMYAGQVNDRREFDIRRSGRSDVPALNLLQASHSIKAQYQNWMDESSRIKAGFSGDLIDNTNDPETGILPLIPDYYSYRGGVFASFLREGNRWTKEAGLRYDLIHQRIAAISTSLPRNIIRDNSTFHNLRAITGLSYQASTDLKIQGSLGYSTRQPDVNERYSNGLHQGVSGIEEGEVHLEQERSLKGLVGINYDLWDKISLESSVYYQFVKNYIYLQPQEEFRLTIRGAFPVYRYQQADATLYGLDFSATFSPWDRLKLGTKYSYIRGQNETENVPLVFMSPPRLGFTGLYGIPKLGDLRNMEIGLEGHFVGKQKHFQESMDYLPPPSEYFLLNFRISSEWQLKTLRIDPYIRVSNVMNVRYRDYLNRQRYFADELGRNLTIGVTIHF